MYLTGTSKLLKNSLLIKSAKTIKIVEYQQIIYIEADNNYSKVFTCNQTENIISKTLGKIESTIDSQIFYRCHKSYVINITYIKEIFIGNEMFVLLKNDKRIPISRRRISNLCKLLTQ